MRKEQKKRKKMRKRERETGFDCDDIDERGGGEKKKNIPKLKQPGASIKP